MAAFSAGFLREADGSLTVTTDATGALYLDGFLRSPTGALVVTTSTAGATMQDDFLRAANGALVVALGAVGTEVAGFLRDTNLALLVATAGGVTGRVAGFSRDASLRLVVTGLAFTPSNLTGLTAWYKADAGTSTVVNAAAISQWNDQSGNANHLTQATGANQPTYQTVVQNNLPTVRFNGTTQFMDASTVSVAQPDTMFIVAKNTAVGGSLNLIDGTTARQAVLQDVAHVYGFYAGLGVVDSASNWGTTLFHYLSVLFNGASSLMREAGGQILTGNPGTGPLTGLRVGTFQPGSGQWQGDVGEIIIASGDQTAQFANMENYLKTRWAL